MYDRNIMNLALNVSKLSNDPSTKVGCVITNKYRDVLSVGYNKLKKFIKQEDISYIYNDKNIKRYATEHAEIIAFKNLKDTDEDLILYITHPSCLPCVIEYLLNTKHNIIEIYYIDRGSDSFKQRFQVNEALDIMNHKSIVVKAIEDDFELN